MTNITKIIGAIAAVAAGGVATPARADPFAARFPVAELHAPDGANTPGSLFATSAMSAQGCSNPTLPADWYTTALSWCKTDSDLLGGSLWPGGCSPSGMMMAATQLFGLDWATGWDASQATMLRSMLASLQTYGAPAMAPIFGQADHWVAITQITATNNAGAWTINQVKAYDGGPPGQADSGFSNYTSGQQVWGGLTWSNIYYMVLSAINPSCDPNCTQDPYFHKYVLSNAFNGSAFGGGGAMAVSPAAASAPSGRGLLAGGTRGDGLPQIAGFDNPPGVTQGGMTARLAQAQVFRALTLAGLDRDPAIWNAIRGGVAGPAFEVNAVWPSGSRWDYFLVPILSRASTVLAFVQLAADDGAFEGLHVLSKPTAFAPTTREHAEAVARGALAAGESLTPAILTWDASGSARLQKSPFLPYYELGVVGADGAAGVVRVPLTGGPAIRGR